jgi:hypothetical protein
MTVYLPPDGREAGLGAGPGPNRINAYVFYERAEQLAQHQRAAQMTKMALGVHEPCARPSPFFAAVS